MNDRDIRPVGPIRPIFLRSRINDSLKLSKPDYSSIARLERQRAINLLLTILCFLVMAACVYLAQV